MVFFFIHLSEQLVWFMAQRRSGTSLTLGMCSGVQRWGGGGTGHYRLLRAHAGPRRRWRQTGQPPHKASNQSAPIHCRWHQDPTGRMGVGDQGQKTLGVRSAQSRLPVDRIWFSINPEIQRTGPSDQKQDWRHGNGDVLHRNSAAKDSPELNGPHCSEKEENWNTQDSSQGTSDQTEQSVETLASNTLPAKPDTITIGEHPEGSIMWWFPVDETGRLVRWEEMSKLYIFKYTLFGLEERWRFTFKWHQMQPKQKQWRDHSVNVSEWTSQIYGLNISGETGQPPVTSKQSRVHTQILTYRQIQTLRSFGPTGTAVTTVLSQHFGPPVFKHS